MSARPYLILLPLSVLAACQAPSEQTPQAASSAESFFAELGSLCTGEAYAGQLVSQDAVDSDFRTAKIVMGPALCTESKIEIPLAVGEDRSRIWQITRTDMGLRLKHDHSHADGSKDTLTQYGGDSTLPGQSTRQEFPVDAETRTLFTAENIEVSNQNTWAVEVDPGEDFAYEMSRPNRFFRLEFDLSEATEAPPPPWALAPIEP